MGTKIQLRRGLKADLPTLDNGEVGFAQDTEELFIGSSSGNKKLTFDATKYDSYDAQLAEKAKQYYVDVKKDFGAKGDGVTNDTSAIQAALNSLVNGGRVYFAEGNYLISSALDIPQNTNIEGAGINKTAIYWVETDTTITSNSTMLRFANNTGYNKSSISNLTLNQKRTERGLGDNQTYGGILACNRFTIEKVRIHNTVGPGITQATIEDVTIKDCEIYDTGHHPIYFSTGNGGYVKNVRISNNFIGTPAYIATREFDANLIKFRFSYGGNLIQNIVIENNNMGSGRGVVSTGQGIFISTTTGTICTLENVTIDNNRINTEAVTDTKMDIPIYIGDNTVGRNISITRNFINSTGVVGTYGMRLLLSDLANSNNIVIRQNTVSQCEIGIQSNKSVVSENNIQFTKYGFMGIEGKFLMNYLTSNTDNAIGVYQSTYDLVENIISMTGVGTIGIDFANSTRMMVVRNKITGAVDGIRRVSKTLTGCIVNENLFVNCTSNYTGIFNSVATVRDNSIEHSTKYRHGATTDRPTVTLTGDRYFDTTLNKAIWWNGTVWKDATGTTV